MNNTDLLLATSYGASVAVIISDDESQNPSKKRNNRIKRIWAREWLLQLPHKGGIYRYSN